MHSVAVVATYFLSAWAKMRWGGWGWATGATFTWAMSRRGTDIGKMLLEYPQLLRLSQWGVLTAEVLSPLCLSSAVGYWPPGSLFFGCFHLFTWLAIRIHFLPTVVCLLAFVPLERIPDLLAGRLRLPWATGVRVQPRGREDRREAFAHCVDRREHRHA